MENLRTNNIDGFKAKPMSLSVSNSEPKYSLGEEILNVVTHGLGALFGVFILLFGFFKGLVGLELVASIFFGGCMLITYSISSVYHGLAPSKGKRVLRVIDHCTVYLLIIGTYSGIILGAIAEYSVKSAVLLLIVQWGIGALAIVLTAVDMKRYKIFSFVCYIALGWCIIVIPHIIIGAMSLSGFMWLLGGGIAYTVGSIMYGIGRRKPYMHGVFHIFCLIGSVLQFVAFAMYCI